MINCLNLYQCCAMKFFSALQKIPVLNPPCFDLLFIRGGKQFYIINTDRFLKSCDIILKCSNINMLLGVFMRVTFKFAF